jgi:hypothetical protein
MQGCPSLQKGLVVRRTYAHLHVLGLGQITWILALSAGELRRQRRSSRERSRWHPPDQDARDVRCAEASDDFVDRFTTRDLHGVPLIPDRLVRRAGLLRCRTDTLLRFVGHWASPRRKSSSPARDPHLRNPPSRENRPRFASLRGGARGPPTRSPACNEAVMLNTLSRESARANVRRSSARTGRQLVQLRLVRAQERPVRPRSGGRPARPA